MANGVGGASGSVKGCVASPGLERGPELLAEAVDVEVGELGLAALVGVGPGDERRDVDLGLGLGQALRPGGLDPDRVRPAGRLGLLAVPPGGLVAAPRRAERGHHQQDRDQQLLPVPAPRGRLVSVGCHARHTEASP